MNEVYQDLENISYNSELVEACKKALSKGIIEEGNLHLALQNGKISLREFLEIIKPN